MAQSVIVRSPTQPAASRPQLPAPAQTGRAVALTGRAPVTMLLPAPETVDPQPSQSARKLALSAPPVRQRRPGHDMPAFDGVPLADHAAIMKGLRRRWLSPGLKRSQHTLLLVCLSGDAAESHRTARALGNALTSLGDLFDFGLTGRALLAPDKPVRHMAKIAEGLRSAVLGDGKGLVLTAGIARMHRDDDPTLVLCNAERHLREAAAMPRGGVVCDVDVHAYASAQRAAQRADQTGDAALSSTDSPQPQADT